MDGIDETRRRTRKTPNTSSSASLKRGATTTTKEEENGNYYGKKTDDDDDDFAPEEIKASSFSPSSRAFCASSSVRCDVVLRSLENLFYFVRFCISEREREKNGQRAFKKRG